MAESQSQEDPTTQVEAASKAFGQEFERFARFTEQSTAVLGLTLDQAESEQPLGYGVRPNGDRGAYGSAAIARVHRENQRGST